ncbi:MAG TPA: DUF1080 domain-containing protein [Burkholderiales bacterium]|jgi:hypothetical protein
MNRKTTIVAAFGVAAASLTLVAGCSMMKSGDGWTTLIDGANGLQNFNQVGTANWRAEDGAIVADRRSDKASAFLMTKDSYRDFQVHVEFYASDDANSGIYMRCEDLNKIADTTCYEANVFDQRPDPTYGTGSIVHHSPIKNMPRAGGKWNTYDITVKGDHLVVTLNGQVTADIHDSRHKAGPLGLQYAGGAIKFRKVQIKPL